MTAHGRDVRNVGELPGVARRARGSSCARAAAVAVSDYLRRELELKLPAARGKTEVVSSASTSTASRRRRRAARRPASSASAR